MEEKLRRRSPQAPSLALDEAIDRVKKAYDKDRLYAAPIEVMAQNLGYRGANNGAALSAFASLRYYGLLDRPKSGFLAVTKDFEHFKFTPDEAQRRVWLGSFLKRPPLFAELLEMYGNNLPSDPSLRDELIQRGFSPAAAEGVLATFKRSVEYAGATVGVEASTAVLHTDLPGRAPKLPLAAPALLLPRAPRQTAIPAAANAAPAAPPLAMSAAAPLANSPVPPTVVAEGATDQIPVRLTGGRQAWLIVPHPLYATDKLRLKAQIDLLLAADDDDSL